MTDAGVAPRSSYARFLPAVLRGTAAPDAFSVDTLLLAAEKILSGIDDGVPVVHGNGTPHTHDGIEAVLDRLHLLLDPYRTPTRFLPVLASWLGVEAARSWDDRQLRRAVAGMASVLGSRGMHEGLHRVLDPFDVGSTRPRITVDDGSRLLFTTPTPGRAAPVDALVSHGPFLVAGGASTGDAQAMAAYPGLVGPGCIAATPDGHLLVGDDGLPGDEPVVAAGLWRISRSGSYVDFDGAAPARPRALAPGGPALHRPRALAVQPRGDSWEAYVLDRDALFRVGRPGPDSLTRLAGRTDLGLGSAATAMVLDGPRSLLVVDRGAVVVLDPEATPPTVVTRHRLSTPGLVPGALALLGGHLVIADLRSQEEPARTPGDTRPADLVLIDRSDPANWSEHRMLADLPDGTNPLVTPVALTVDGPASLLALDLGLRPVAGDSGDPSHKVMAEPGAVYRVRLQPAAGTGRPVVTEVERVTASGRLTNPNGMALVEGTVYISDPGQPLGADDNLLVRNMPGHIVVQVHFSRQRTAGVPTETRRRIASDIAAIVDRHAPASVVAARPLVPTEPDEGEHRHV